MFLSLFKKDVPKKHVTASPRKTEKTLSTVND